MNLKRVFILLTFLCLVPKLLSSKADKDSLVGQWNKVMNQALIETAFPVQAQFRAIAITHNAMFNALAAYDPKAISDPPTKFSRRPKSERTLANKETAISYAAYYALKDLFPTQISILDEFMHTLGCDIKTLPNDPNSAARIGARAAKILIKSRRNDKSNQQGDLNPSGIPYSEPILLAGYTPYKYVNTFYKLRDINYWQPTTYPDGTPQIYEMAQHGFVTPFAMTSGSQFRPKEPKRTFTDYKGFKAQAQQIYDIDKTSTPKTRLIATFWDSVVVIALSPMHDIAARVAKRDNYSLDDEVKLFFAVSNTMFDADISVWETKRFYNSVRPITAIRHLIDPKWVPHNPTHPSPEYSSGHAGEMSSLSVILQQFTGSDYYGASYTDPETGIILSWKTFTDAVVEAGWSRMYGGVHFENAVLTGQKQGRKVGWNAWKKIKKLIGR